MLLINTHVSCVGLLFVIHCFHFKNFKLHLLIRMTKTTVSNLWPVFGNNVRLKERNTRRKITVRRKKRSIDPVNQSIKHSLIQTMTLPKEEKGPVMKTLTRSVTRLDQIQRMNQVKEKGRERRIIMKTENTKKDLPVTTGVKAKSKTIEKMLITEGRINMKTKNTEKDYPVITRVKAKEKTIKKMLMTEMIISQSQEDMLQKVSPILMSLKGEMGAFENQALLDLLLIHSDVNHTISGEMWLLSFQKKRGLLNLGRCNLLLSYMKGRDGNV